MIIDDDTTEETHRRSYRRTPNLEGEEFLDKEKPSSIGHILISLSVAIITVVIGILLFFNQSSYEKKISQSAYKNPLKSKEITLNSKTETEKQASEDESETSSLSDSSQASETNLSENTQNSNDNNEQENNNIKTYSTTSNNPLEEKSITSQNREKDSSQPLNNRKEKNINSSPLAGAKPSIELPKATPSYSHFNNALSTPSEKPIYKNPIEEESIYHGTIYTIQVGSFRKRSQADKLVKELNRKFQGLSINIKKKKVKGIYYYRVRVGSYLSEEKASREIRKIHLDREYNDAFIMKTYQ